MSIIPHRNIRYISPAEEIAEKQYLKKTPLFENNGWTEDNDSTPFLTNEQRSKIINVLLILI